jgi:hypothetical protein
MMILTLRNAFVSRGRAKPGPCSSRRQVIAVKAFQAGKRGE